MLACLLGQVLASLPLLHLCKSCCQKTKLLFQLCCQAHPSLAFHLEHHHHLLQLLLAANLLSRLNGKTSFEVANKNLKSIFWSSSTPYTSICSVIFSLITASYFTVAAAVIKIHFAVILCCRSVIYTVIRVRQSICCRSRKKKVEAAEEAAVAFHCDFRAWPVSLSLHFHFSLATFDSIFRAVWLLHPLQL